MKLIVSAKINATEDEQKVLRAVKNIFPSLDFKKEGNSFIGQGSEVSLEAFKKHLQIQNIGVTAISFLSSKIEGDLLEFELNKQAAVMGKVNFVDFSMPLGTIEVKLTGTRLQQLVDDLCL